MKKLINLCSTFLLALTIVFCVTACGGGSEKTVTYEITVDTQNVSVDTDAVKVCLYGLDGTLVREENLTAGKATFEVQADRYVATVSGLDETVSFSSVLLTKNQRKATISLENSQYNDLMEYYTYAFTVIFLIDGYKLSDLTAQICDLDLVCMTEEFENGNVVDIVTNGGECSVELFDADYQEIYNETFTVDTDKRFYVVQL